MTSSHNSPRDPTGSESGRSPSHTVHATTCASTSAVMLLQPFRAFPAFSSATLPAAHTCNVLFVFLNRRCEVAWERKLASRLPCYQESLE